MEAQLCGNAEVTIVGAGNSAGQGAIYLASVAKKVHVIFRRSSLRETMSEYLVKRLEEHPNIEIIPSTDVVEIGRAHVLTPVTNAQLVCRLLLEKKTKKTNNR